MSNTNKLMTFRTTQEQKTAIEAKAEQYGFDSVGAYIKFVCINAELVVHVAPEPQAKENRCFGE